MLVYDVLVLSANDANITVCSAFTSQSGSVLDFSVSSLNDKISSLEMNDSHIQSEGSDTIQQDRHGKYWRKNLKRPEIDNRNRFWSLNRLHANPSLID
jgi:hypothetical protein